jgi:hypothetical protein
MTFTTGDFNHDGNVNAMDFNVLATAFGIALAPAPAGDPSLGPTSAASLFADGRPIAPLMSDVLD